MIKCSECDYLYNFKQLSDCCPQCEHQLKKIKGTKVFVTNHSKPTTGFKADFFDKLAPVEHNSFWFKTRNLLITRTLNKFIPNFKRFLEIGCGTGYVMAGISKAFSGSKLTGSEIFPEGLLYASQRSPNADFIQMDAREIPFVNEFDVIGAFDVLEHIPEDEDVLNEIYNALKPKGFLIITVPQHMWLWSPVDELACHERRYSPKEIHRKVKQAGFTIIHSTSFVSFLLPAMLISRFASKKNKEGGKAELEISKGLNIFFYIIMLCELYLIKLGVRFPVGGSRLVLAHKSG